MNQEHYGSDETRSWCRYHPTQLVIGICALCLNEKLLILAAKQGPAHQSHKLTPKKAKVFALTSWLNLLDIKHQKAANQNHRHSSSTSPEDSFISIKFEDNGVALWDKGKISKMPLDQRSEMLWNDSWDKANKVKSVVEHAKPRTTMRWRRRIGHLFQLIRWKRSKKGNVCHVGTKPRRTKS